MTTTVSYKTILGKAKEIKTSVEKEYKLPYSTPVYYIAKAILKPNTNINKINVETASNGSGDYISNQIYKSDYLDMAKRLTAYVEKYNKLPNYITWKNKKVKVKDYVYMFSRILVYYDAHTSYPKYADVNSKAYTKPVEYKNVVYKYFVEKTGKSYKTIDDLLSYVKVNFKYEYYYDDRKSNKQVIDSKAGNCVDLLQFLCNMVEEMGYSWKCIHVKCRSSGAGHVFGKFKHPKHTGGEWITRDIACVADGGNISCVWCGNGVILAENPQWWLNNLNR